ncbi:MAG: oligosaccharide flippase family protein [Chitinivibrionales bacterium]|nr:oligosaccharide flippase family protein [Chitinivibrionales bacterium]MBD3355589.1 oligosaccharide flippase family protein [Chitinivibrionales bacterium]
MSLKEQVSYGIKWTSASMVLVRALRFLTTVVLARLLVPEMFGLIALANVAIDTMALARQIGLGPAYIYKTFSSPAERKRAEKTIFLTTLAMNGALFTICFTSAPAIAQFFNNAMLTDVLKVMAFSFPVGTLQTVPNVIMLKKMQFGKTAASELVSACTYSLVGITLAFMGFGIWSLVAAQLISRFVSGIVFMVLARWVPRFGFELSIARELFSYGKFIWAFTVLSAVGGALDRVFVGKLWGSASLGYYHIAFNMCQLSGLLFATLMEKVTFPAYSTLKNEPGRLRNAVTNTMSSVSIIVVPLAFGLIVLSERIIGSIFGEKWLPAAPLVDVLAFHGLIHALAPISSSVLKATGRPNVLMNLGIAHHVLKFALLFLLRPLGTVGIALAVVLSMGLSTATGFGIVVRCVPISVSQLLKPFLGTVPPAAVMFIVLKLMQESFADGEKVTSWPVLGGLVVLGVVLYSVATFLFNRNNFMVFRRLLVDVAVSKGGQ